MVAPKGNQFWKSRSSHGRKPIFQTPEQLWGACTEYFEWVDKHPLKAAELVKYQGDATEKEVPKMRAMTIHGLCLFLGISRRTWGNNKERDDFLPVIKKIEMVLYEQKFTGAAAGLLNPNIIARDLGLKESRGMEGELVVRIVKFSGDGRKELEKTIAQREINT